MKQCIKNFSKIFILFFSLLCPFYSNELRGMEVPIEPKPNVGLNNLNNTCFMNAVIQALGPTVNRYLMEAQWMGLQFKDSVISSYIDLLNFLKPIGAAVAPNNFIDQATDKPDNFHTIFANKWAEQQQDANQFLGEFINYLSEKMPGLTKTLNLPIILQKITTCVSCQKTSDLNAQPDQQNILQLNTLISREEVRSLEGCIDAYLEEKIVHRMCENCRKIGDQSDRNAFISLPNVLMITLGRYKYTKTEAEKISKTIKFPNVLKINEGYGNNTKKQTFQLKSFVCHNGKSSNFGHYVAYVKYGDQWYLYNDAVVSKKFPRGVEEAKIDTYATPYILIYEKEKVFVPKRSTRSTTVNRIEEKEKFQTKEEASAEFARILQAEEEKKAEEANKELIRKIQEEEKGEEGLDRESKEFAKILQAEEDAKFAKRLQAE